MSMILDAKKTDAATPDDDEAAKKKQAERARLMSLYKSPSKAGLLSPAERRRRPLTQEERISGLLEEAQARAPPAVARVLLQAKPVIVPLTTALIFLFNLLGPLYLYLFKAGYFVLSSLPWDLLQATIGLGLCFFGGHYCASIAACEAFYMTGWPTTVRHLNEVYDSAVAVAKANEEDDEKDEDGDGIADVKQITASQLIDRKMKVAFGAVREPQKLATAVGGLYTGWLAVQGTLRIKFAKTINLAVSASQFCEYYVTKALLPFATPFVERSYVHWLPVGISSVTRGIFIWLAWKMQEVVSAAQSAMRGGLLCSRGVLNHLNKRGYKSFLGLSLEASNTYIDEAVGFALAFLGFAFQLTQGFAIPFPLNWVMLPLDMVEWYIRYEVTTSGEAA